MEGSWSRARSKLKTAPPELRRTRRISTHPRSSGRTSPTGSSCPNVSHRPSAESHWASSETTIWTTGAPPIGSGRTDPGQSCTRRSGVQISGSAPGVAVTMPASGPGLGRSTAKPIAPMAITATAAIAARAWVFMIRSLHGERVGARRCRVESMVARAAPSTQSGDRSGTSLAKWSAMRRSRPALMSRGRPLVHASQGRRSGRC